MNHLDNILIRERSTRVRDALFAVFVALTAMLSISTVSTAVHAASTHVISR